MSKPALDWDARHGVWTGVLNGALTATTAAAIGTQVGLPPTWALAAGTAGALGTTVAGAVRRQLTKASITYRAGCWLVAGGWTSWALAYGLTDTSSLGALAVGTIAAGALGGDLAHHERAVLETRQKLLAPDLEGERRAVAKEWMERLERVGDLTLRGVRVIAVEQWPTGAGYTLEGELPPGGATWKTVRNLSDALASDAALPEGCGIEVGHGIKRNLFLMRVSTVNRLADSIDYPDDYTPLTLNGPTAIGVHATGDPAEIVMRSLSGLLAGQKGSGKTNLLNVVIANLCRMNDNLTWVIDLNGGGLAQKWMRAWVAAGRPGRPPIDWVAGDEDEALLMARAAVAIAKTRKISYQDREIAADDDKLPVGPDVPGINIITDECAEIHSPKTSTNPVLNEVRKLLVQTLEIARAAAVNELTCGLRVTQDVIKDPQVLKQSGLRIGLRVSDDNELKYLFGWNARVSPEEAPYEGCGFVKVGTEQPRAFKAYRIKPSQIARVVTETATYRPTLDQISARVAGDDYANRWERTAHLFGATTAPAPGQAATPAQTSNTARPARTTPQTLNEAQQAAEDAREKLRRRMAEKQNQTPVGNDPDLERELRRVLGEAGAADWSDPQTWPEATPHTPGQPESTEAAIDERRAFVRQLIASAGPGGLDTSTLWQALTDRFGDDWNRSVVTTWLGDDVRTGRMHKPGNRNGRYAYGPADETGE